MSSVSPLRYPGGKSSMTGLLAQVRRLNGLGGYNIAEPFAGGAGASLALLYKEEAREIYINDADPSIYSFWWAITNKHQNFIKLLSEAEISIDEWRRQRDIYRNNRYISKLRRGFSAFYLNRCNRSGIIMNGGPIGGMSQDGEWKIDARFNKIELKSRCQKIAEYRDRIHVSSLDGIEFIKSLNMLSTLFFIDPPYFVKGKTLYLNGLNEEYHANLARQLKSMSDAAWVLTYDDCPEIRRLYEDWAVVRPFSLRYVAADRRSGREVLIVPKWMCLPESQSSAAINW